MLCPFNVNFVVHLVFCSVWFTSHSFPVGKPWTRMLIGCLVFEASRHSFALYMYILDINLSIKPWIRSYCINLSSLAKFKAVVTNISSSWLSIVYRWKARDRFAGLSLIMHHIYRDLPAYLFIYMYFNFCIALYSRIFKLCEGSQDYGGV